MGDVARAAGVSTALVSIVMRGVPGASEATRRRVLEIADDMGYVPDRRAQKLRQASSRLLGVVFELQQPFHGDLVEQIYAAAARRGYDVMLSAVAPSRAEQVAVQALMRERCEAAILLGSRFDADALGELADRVPALVVARSSGLPGVGAVRGDDVTGITLAVDHLAELGHRRIAHIDGADAPGGSDRRAGFLAAMGRHGLSETATVVTGGPTETEGAQGMQELLEMTDPPTAVVAFNDRCATGVLDLLVRRGLDVPADISVVGYDDSRLARIPHVQMTTISQDATQMADAAVDGALAQIAGHEAVDLVLAPRLIRRSTTGPVSG
ncbi:LacI family DNA-binding transcriptional regulator [Rhodococcus wratislaviensis]|nr:MULTISPECIES: LacI family DNA-binding transcriptional regulator [unclassified Rhodococcus (in: high G+C Gram-positive bacteria)]MBC2642591.1 LacI family DNA-binding transcriptional regulator [Rhodococcus sp. 3A]MBC2892667.1 LacI family DNA-binding transcriptional regulator [Rhodococcus sp. 4CII]